VTGSCDADRWGSLFATDPQMGVVLMVMPRAPEALDANRAQLMAKFHDAAFDFAEMTGALTDKNPRGPDVGR